MAQTHTHTQTKTHIYK